LVGPRGLGGGEGWTQGLLIVLVKILMGKDMGLCEMCGENGFWSKVGNKRV